MSPYTTKLGPFTLTFEPDGDDPGTGAVTLETDSGYWSRTPFGVPRDEWDEFAGTSGSA